jgi:alpha-1,2-mannosyltransferase
MTNDNVVTPQRLEFYLAALLVVGIALLIHAESTPGVLDRHGKVRGRDFLQFYLAGRIAAEGDIDRLYDQKYFGLAQLMVAPVDERNPRYYSLYPPTIAWLFRPLGRLPYSQAVVTWWTILVCLFVAELLVLYRLIHPRLTHSAGEVEPKCELATESDTSDELDWRDPADVVPPATAQGRRITILALAIFYPAFISILNGQLSFLVLGALLLGFALQVRERPILAGVVLSVLAIKPQFAAGIGVWLFFRRDWRTIVGVLTGLTLQVVVVGSTLGFDVWRDYRNALPMYGRLAKLFQFTADYEHSITGILSNVLGRQHLGIARGIHAIIAFAAAWQLWRIVRPFSKSSLRREQSAAVLFTLLVTPHLLVYDLTVLLFPIAVLWAEHQRSDEDSTSLPDGLLLYSAAMLAPAYLVTGFSIVPVALFWVLTRHSSVCNPRSAQRQ